ncbi:unnamed protein product [Amoebophrya sp. A120]|nr:unnamed protein product [Amoebophrya sp. A120]|eukprot:GSA120T00004944001.1
MDDNFNMNDGGIRKRNVGAETPAARDGDSFIKKFDIYNKVHDDYNIKTKSGGTISLLTYISMLILIAGELRFYLSTRISDHIVVDTTTDEKLPIGLNITFPDLRCDEVSVDTVDSSGENQINIDSGGLQKYPVDRFGRFGEDPVAPEGACLSCYAAASNMPEGSCCNDCKSLKEAYTQAGLSYYKVLKESEQCKHIVGCVVDGDVLVSKVAGNVHVALGKSIVRQGRHVHEFNIRDVSEGFNTSHIINRLQFGPRFNGLVDAPLRYVEDCGPRRFHVSLLHQIDSHDFHGGSVPRDVKKVLAPVLLHGGQPQRTGEHGAASRAAWSVSSLRLLALPRAETVGIHPVLALPHQPLCHYRRNLHDQQLAG